MEERGGVVMRRWRSGEEKVWRSGGKGEEGGVRRRCGGVLRRRRKSVEEEVWGSGGEEEEEW